MIDFLKAITRASEGDFIDAIIRLTILDANVRHLVNDPTANQAYARFEAPVPDELRRPASINSIAGSIGLPFETVRRRVHSMHQRGLCIAGQGGVILSAHQVFNDSIRDLLDETFARVARFHDDLRRLAPEIELVPEAERADPSHLALSEPPVRTTFRVTTSYVLRDLELARPLAGDLLSAIVLLAIVVANVEHITHDPVASATYGAPGAVVPDEARRRILVQPLARSLGLPFETTRRRVIGLIEQGLCRRDEAGVYAPAALLLSPIMATHRENDARSIQRLFSTLWRLGVRFEAESVVPA